MKNKKRVSEMSVSFPPLHHYPLLIISGHEGQTAFPAAPPIEVLCHENTGATFLILTLTGDTGDLVVTVNLVVLQCAKRVLAMLMLDFLGLGEILFFALLASTTKTKNKVKCRLLLNVVITKSPPVFQLLSSKDKALLIRRNAYTNTRSPREEEKEGKGNRKRGDDQN
eukprot:TRINITY_DN1801_c0_g2_i1.p1 TRINITY_DN1801_c0_g2~~TRINITY_DN1801_c0_g2_i1.p1  ORF type:complete len:168 (+),score=24.48 TRINITY_DN1801_c0_g2_i1:156-659(+)